MGVARARIDLGQAVNEKTRRQNLPAALTAALRGRFEFRQRAKETAVEHGFDRRRDV